MLINRKEISMSVKKKAPALSVRYYVEPLEAYSNQRVTEVVEQYNSTCEEIRDVEKNEPHNVCLCTETDGQAFAAAKKIDKSLVLLFWCREDNGLLTPWNPNPLMGYTPKKKVQKRSRKKKSSNIQKVIVEITTRVKGVSRAVDVRLKKRRKRR